MDPNPVMNSSFENVNEDGTPEGWTTPDSTPLASNSAYTGAKSLGFWKEAAYTFEAFQTITGLTNGTYTLSAWSQGAGEEMKNQLYAVSGDQTQLTSSFANKGWNVWNKAAIENIKVIDGTLKIGVSLDAKPYDWGSYDDFVLVKTSDSPGRQFPQLVEVPAIILLVAVTGELALQKQSLVLQEQSLVLLSLAILRFIP